MFPNPADGLRADRAPGTVGAARRRRDRRFRAFLKHERLAVAMNMATTHHHSFMKSAVVDVSVQVGSPFAPVTEYVAPAPAVTLSVPSLQFRPAYTSATVAVGVNFDVTGFVNPLFSRTAVEGSASQVVDPLPPAEEFALPVFYQVHQEQSAAGEMTENTMDSPVVPEQGIVQAIPRVVGSLPPGEVFAAPVYHQVHHEQFAAGETTEKSAEFPVVQEQVIVQASPRVVDSLPPVTEFTVPAYNPVHQEQFSAGETTENIANIPVVQDQVLVQAFPRAFPPVEEFTAYVASRPSPSLPPWCKSLMLLCRRWWTTWRRPYGYWIDRLPSRLSQCPQFLALRVRRVLVFLNRSQRISWLKCRQSCLPRASLFKSRSRLLTLQFLAVMFEVPSQDRAQRLVVLPKAPGEGSPDAFGTCPQQDNMGTLSPTLRRLRMRSWVTCPSSLRGPAGSATT